MKINNLNSHYSANYIRKNININNKAQFEEKQNLKTTNLPSFGGFISNIIYPFQYNLETKLDYKEIFDEIEKRNPHFRTLFKKLIMSGDLLNSIHNYNSMEKFASNFNPNYMEQISDDTVSISALTAKPESFIKYKNEVKYFPEIRKSKMVRTPQKIIIGESNKFGGSTEEVYDIEQKVVMKNIKSNFADPMDVQRVEVLDVAKCTIPAFQFLEQMDCDKAILNDVKMSSDGKIIAKSIITYKKDSNNGIKVKDVYLNSKISQSRVHSSENPNAYPDWRIIVDADNKFSSIDKAKYNTMHDYGTKSVVQKNVKEIFEPKEGKWYGKNDYTITPNPKAKKGKIDYTCQVACRTINGKPNQWLKSKIIAA